MVARQNGLVVGRRQGAGAAPASIRPGGANFFSGQNVLMYF
jgi:hypothetical protein